ncbi:MAG: hypothetical protein KDB22_10325 [Planctomycetales bacterium]|nr:hypothetical protein [Planctomycetales bacterium]
MAKLVPHTGVEDGRGTVDCVEGPIAVSTAAPVGNPSPGLAGEADVANGISLGVEAGFGVLIMAAFEY